MPYKIYGFTQSSYPALYLPSDEDYKTRSDRLYKISQNSWTKKNCMP